MWVTNLYGIQNIGSITESSDTHAVPSPKELLWTSHYQQPPGCHPGQPPGAPPRHWALPANEEQVELVTHGRGWVRTGDAWVEVTAGALLWHVEGDQTIGASDWENPYQCLSVRFRTGSYAGRRADRLSWWHQPDVIQQFSRELLHSFQEGRPDLEILFHYAYGRLLFESRRGQQRSPEWPRPLREAVAWLDANATGPCPLKVVAREVGWSVAHLHESFQARLGMTPHQFVLGRRIRLARERLALTAQPIKQIAADAGFSTSAAFCRAFKDRTGLTPLEYRHHEQSGGRGSPSLRNL